MEQHRSDKKGNEAMKLRNKIYQEKRFHENVMLRVEKLQNKIEV